MKQNVWERRTRCMPRWSSGGDTRVPSFNRTCARFATVCERLNSAEVTEI